MNAAIDLNADVGEGMPTDHELLQFVSSANIACGYHAGSTHIMQQTVAACLHRGVAIGAHPGYADTANFGRKYVALNARQLQALIWAQLEALDAVCRQAGARLHHVKPHGALYNRLAAHPEEAAVVANAIATYNKDLWYVGLAGSHSIKEAENAGLKVVHEFFADRTYQPDGSLTQRSWQGAVIEDESMAMGQALEIARYRQVRSQSNQVVKPIKSQHTSSISICLHGDNARAVAFAQTINARLQQEGFTIKAPGL